MANMSYIFQLFIGLVLFLAIFPVPSKQNLFEKTNKPTDLVTNSGKTKDAKVFNIFSIVQFKNTGCISEMTLTSSSGNTYRNGTCFTAAECTEKGGSSSGSCAGGFGVCCVFMTSTCGASISVNCSYIKNPGFPSAFTSTSGCSYTINKCDSSVCDIRLDFEQFTTNAPSTTLEADTSADVGGGVCQDQLTITTNTGQSIPEICGTNSGQHLYLDLGRQSSDTATLAFTFSGTFSRYWDIKVTQIPCDVNYDQPNGCLQYHTGIDGRFTTFNWGGTQHLRNQNYRVCIRQEEGYCCIIYMQCSTAAFRINSSTQAAYTKSQIGSNCSEDYIGIEGSSQSGVGNANSIYCGGFLNDFPAATTDAKIKDCTSPFEVSVVTDASQDAIASTIASSNKGVCLEWTQEPCAAGHSGAGP